MKTSARITTLLAALAVAACPARAQSGVSSGARAYVRVS
jgi:hypothetical protein